MCLVPLKTIILVTRKAKRIYNSQQVVQPGATNKNQQNEVRLAWGTFAEEYITKQADTDLFGQCYFATLTTQYALTLNSCRRAAQRFADVVKRKGNTITLCWFAEAYEAKDGYHLHALVATNAARNDLNDAWKIASKANKSHAVKIARENDIAINDAIYASDNEPHLREVMQSRSHFVIYKRGAGGGSYAAKYITKKGNTTDYDIVL